jgi:ribosomal protein S18 acetylase RimI-like enzyme
MADYEVLWLEDADQTRQAAGVAARALRDSPTAIAASKDPLFRLEMLYGTFAGSMLSRARIAGVRRGDCVLGLAAALPPGHCVASMLPPEVRSRGALPFDATDSDRFLHCGYVVADHDAPEAHWHVGPVGVEPGFQGKGMGRAAMTLLCEEFDQLGLLAWLETDTSENVLFYEGLGFEVVEEVPMLSVPQWFMRRDALPGRASSTHSVPTGT